MVIDIFWSNSWTKSRTFGNTTLSDWVLSGGALSTMEKALKFALPDEVWGGTIDEYHVLLWTFAYIFVIVIVFIKVIALNDLREDLPHLSKKDCFFVLKIFHKELVTNDVSVRVVFVTSLQLHIESHRLANNSNTNSGLSLLTFRPSGPSSLASS